MVRAFVFMAFSLFAAASHAGFRQFTIEYKVEGKAAREMGEKIVYHMDRDRFRQDMMGGSRSLVMEKKGDKLVQLVIDHEQKVYLRSERPLKEDDEREFKLGSENGLGDPCADDPKYRCERLGEGKLLGYRVVKWRVIEPDGETSEVWYAPALGYYLKFVDPQENLTMTAVRVVNERPPADTFAPPKGYQEQNPGALLGGMMAVPQGAAAPPDEDEEAAAPAAPSMIEEDVKEIATEVGETAHDTAKDEVKARTKKKVRDAIRGLFGD